MVTSARGQLGRGIEKGTFLNNLRDSHKTGFPAPRQPTIPTGPTQELIQRNSFIQSQRVCEQPSRFSASALICMCTSGTYRGPLGSFSAGWRTMRVPPKACRRVGRNRLGFC